MLDDKLRHKTDFKRHNMGKKISMFNGKKWSLNNLNYVIFICVSN